MSFGSQAVAAAVGRTLRPSLGHGDERWRPSLAAYRVLANTPGIWANRSEVVDDKAGPVAIMGAQRGRRYRVVMVEGLPPEPAGVEFEQSVADALDSLPADLREYMSNVAIVIEEEPPPGMPWLGLYQGLPLTRGGSAYAGVAPDKITIFRRPLERHYGTDPARLRQEIRRVVLHEVAHHFGISDERLVELDRY